MSHINFRSYVQSIDTLFYAQYLKLRDAASLVTQYSDWDMWEGRPADPGLEEWVDHIGRRSGSLDIRLAAATLWIHWDAQRTLAKREEGITNAFKEKAPPVRTDRA